MKVTDAEPNDNEYQIEWGKMRMVMTDMMDCIEEAWGGPSPGQLEL